MFGFESCFICDTVTRVTNVYEYNSSSFEDKVNSIAKVTSVDCMNDRLDVDS